MSCIKKLAYMEPLVDTVDFDALVTNPVKIFVRLLFASLFPP